jgi:DNA-binding NarL/FixJ family response regulator
MAGISSSNRMILSLLSAREIEVVTRLVAGDRVPTIARALFLSQSTVRNQLSSVFTKTGVHSQQELLDRLRNEAALSQRE